MVPTTAVEISAGEQRARGVDIPGPQVLAEALRLRVAARRRGDAVAEQPVDDEVEAPEVRERVTLDRQVCRLRHQRPETLDAELVLEPGVRRTAPRPDADVG